MKSRYTCMNPKSCCLHSGYCGLFCHVYCDVLLTVHLSIILVISQLDAQNLVL